MVSNFHLPPVGFGPGSQPEGDEELGYMQLPSGMRTYSAHLPEVEDSSAVAPALKLLSEIAAAAEACAQGGMASFDLAGLDAQNRALIAETMGQGAIAKSLREKIWPLIEAGKIKPVIYKTFPLAEAREAHRLMETSQHIGKLVLTV